MRGVRAHVNEGAFQTRQEAETQVLYMAAEHANNSETIAPTTANMSKDSDEGKLFVGALSKDTTVESMKDYFSAYGEVIDCNVKIDQVTKRPRGFGFVQFQDASSAVRVLNEGPHIVDGKKVDPKKACPVGKLVTRGGGSRTKKIFVGGLKPDTPGDIVKNYFAQYGTVTNVDLVVDNTTQQRRGFCFVEFDSEDVVDLVLQKQYHDLAQGIKVEVKSALTKEEQAAKKAQEFGGGYRGAGRGIPAMGYSYPSPGAAAYASPYYATAYPGHDPTGYPTYPGYGPPPTYGTPPSTSYDYTQQSTYGAIRYPGRYLFKTDHSFDHYSLNKK